MKRHFGCAKVRYRGVATNRQRTALLSVAEIRSVGHAPWRYTLVEIDAAIGRLVRDGDLIEV